jgi:hypothetical protein
VAELTPIPTAQRPSDAGYQPVSGYAVAAALVAGLFPFALLLFRNAAVLVLPLAGVILAIVARSHIRRSEGTRTGLRIVSACWWVCVLGGAGFGAYLFASSLVMERKSGAVVDRLFQELKEGKVEAFKRMVPSEERYRVGAQDAMPNSEYEAEFEKAYQSFNYASFKNHELVQLFARNGQSIEWEHKGCKGIASEGTGLQATHFYVVRCPEGIYDIRVQVVSPETKKGEKVDWYIPNTPGPNFTITKAHPSHYGVLVKAMQQDGEMEAKAWLGHIAASRTAMVHLMTTAPEHYRPINEFMVQLLFLGGAPCGVIPVGPGVLPSDRGQRWQAEASKLSESGKALSDEQFFRLAFNDLLSIGFFRRDDVGGRLTEDQLEQLRKIWTNRRVNAGAEPSQGPSRGGASFIRFTPDAITVIFAIHLMPELPRTYARGLLAVECTDPEVLRRINDARESGLSLLEDPSKAQAVFPAGFPARNWRIAWLQTDMEMNTVTGLPTAKR